MQHVISWLLFVAISCTLLVTNFQSFGLAAEKRMAKQELNLAGKQVVQYLSREEGDWKLDGKAFAQHLQNTLRQEGFLGIVVVYSDCIVGFDSLGEETKRLSYTDGQRSNLPNMVNQVVNSLVNRSESALAVSIALQKEWTGMTDPFFSAIDGLSVFLLSRGGNYPVVSGYTLHFASEQGIIT